MYFIPENSRKNQNDLTFILVVEEFFRFSRSSDDLTVNLAASFASIVPRVAVYCRVHLSVEFAHVIRVKDGDLVSFFAVLWDVLIVAGDAIFWCCSLEFSEDFRHSAFKSGSPGLVFYRFGDFVGVKIDDLPPSKLDDLEFKTAIPHGVIAMHSDDSRSSFNELFCREASVDWIHLIISIFSALFFFLVRVSSFSSIIRPAEVLFKIISSDSYPVISAGRLLFDIKRDVDDVEAGDVIAKLDVPNALDIVWIEISPCI